MKRYKFECYFRNPATGEGGWSIHMIVIIANDRQAAVSRLQSIPCFDCIITSLYCGDIDRSDMTAEEYTAMQGYVIDDTLL